MATEELATEKEGRSRSTRPVTRSTTACSVTARRLSSAPRRPWADHRYLTRLGELAGDGLQVLLYDQLGSGKSDVLDDPALWVVPRFVEELETVRTALGLGRVHLMGQSWGGFSRSSMRSTIRRA